MAKEQKYAENRAILYTGMIIMMISGSWVTIFSKLLVETKDRNGEKFKHPYFMTLAIDLGCLLAFPFYFMYKSYATKKYGSMEQNPDALLAQKAGKIPYMKGYYVLIVSAFSVLTLPLQNFGLILVDASVSQMLRGIVVFITAMLSVIILKAKLHRHHWTSLFLIFVGIGLVGLSSILNNDTESRNAIVGVLLIFLAQFFLSAYLLTEEALLKKFYIHPLRLVAYEGLWGTMFITIILFVFYFIPCNESFWTNGRLEDAIYAFQQLFSSYTLILFFLAMMAGTLGFNLCSIIVIKYGSAAQNSTVDVTRNVFVWVFFLSFRGKGHESFQYLQLIGFIIAITGTTIYNEIYVPPIFGFDKNTKMNKKKQEDGVENSFFENSNKENDSSLNLKLNTSDISSSTPTKVD